MQRNRIILTMAVLFFLAGSRQSIGQGAPAINIPAGPYVKPQSPEEAATMSLVSELDTQAAAALSGGQYSSAESSAEQALSLTNDFRAGLILAESLNAEGKEGDAFQEYGKLAKAGTDDPQVFLPYGLGLLRRGDWRSALAAYNKCLPRVGFGDILRSRSQFASNVAQPNELATAIHIAMGLTMDSGPDLAGKSQSDRAVSEFEQAVALSPGSDLAEYYHGFGLAQARRYVDAKAAFRKAVVIGDNDIRLAASKELARLN